jgi:hypothetical protein
MLAYSFYVDQVLLTSGQTEECQPPLGFVCDRLSIELLALWHVDDAEVDKRCEMLVKDDQ